MNQTRLNNFFITSVILFLIACPSFSILYALTHIYIPNEKLAIAFLLLYAVMYPGKFILHKESAQLFWVSGIIVLLIILIKLFFYDDHIITYVDFHYTIVLFYLPFYISFFKQKREYVTDSLKIILWIHLAVSVFQWICILNGKRELAKIFNNYPYQENYYFESFFGFVRVSGLFFESSQLAIFFLITAAYFKSNNRGLFYLTVLCALSTYSFTGFVGVFLIVVQMVVKKEIKVKYLLILGSFSVFFLAKLFERFIGLITVIFSSEVVSQDSNFNRFTSLQTKFDFLLSNYRYIWLGYANSFDFPSFDFFSVYIFGFGIIGFSFFLIIMVSLFYKANRTLWPVMICSLLGNSVILSSIVMLLYISAFVLSRDTKNKLV